MRFIMQDEQDAINLCILSSGAVDLAFRIHEKERSAASYNLLQIALEEESRCEMNLDDLRTTSRIGDHQMISPTNPTHATEI